MMDFEWLSNTGVALVEKETGLIKECNSALQTLVGPDANVGKSIWNAMGSSTTPFYNETREVSLQTMNKEEEEEDESTSTATTKWLSVQTKLVQNNTFLFLQISDITLQKVADERAMAFLTLSFDGFWDWRMKEDYEYMSPRFWEMFGYSPKEKQHKPSEWQSIIFQEDVPALMETLQKHIATRGTYPFRTECRYRHKDGSTVVVACNGRIIEWSEVDGSPVRMLGTHTDITELRREQKIATERCVNDFLAHKVRNPLTSAVQASQFLQTALREDNNKKSWKDDPMVKERVEGDIALIHDNLMNISSLIGRLAELDKIHSNKIQYTYAPTVIETEVLEPLKTLCMERVRESGKSSNNNTIASKKIWVETRCYCQQQQQQQQQLVAKLDVQRMKQALFSIVDGSVERLKTTTTTTTTTNEGFIRICASADTRNKNNLLTFVVQDSGPKVMVTNDLLLGGSSDGIQQSTTTGHLPAGVYTARALIHGMGGKFAIHTTTTTTNGGGGGKEEETTTTITDGKDKENQNGNSKNASSSSPGLKIVITLPNVVLSGGDSSSLQDGEQQQQQEGTTTTTTTPSENGGTTTSTNSTTNNKNNNKNNKNHDTTTTSATTATTTTTSATTIDEYYINRRCLVIDDDKIVNKMMKRRLSQLIPGCEVDCAKTGEEGIEMAKQTSYGLVIVDHYMPGPGMPLNGAETICQLRLLGMEAAIVGCSANDVAAIHLEAGANSFIQKPAQPNTRFIEILNSAVPKVA